MAAQNCRKRKLDQIMGLQQEVDGMFNQKLLLQAQQDHLLVLRQQARDKYSKLYNFILESSSSFRSQYLVVNTPPDYPHHNEHTAVEHRPNPTCDFATNTTSKVLNDSANFQLDNE